PLIDAGLDSTVFWAFDFALARRPVDAPGASGPSGIGDIGIRERGSDPPPIADCNDNSVPDLCDIEDGTSPDVNGNDIPDECEPTGLPIGSIEGGIEVRNRPDPFTASTTIRFRINEPGPARVEIFDVRGRLVWRTYLESAGAGDRALSWDGRGHGGAELPAGVYFGRVTTGSRTGTDRLVILR
ncbi:MAG: T9SS type A sorting domain-containing protein, partial [Candidatus Eisenbacteria bacterium]